MEKKLTYAEAAKQVKEQTKEQRGQSGVSVEGNKVPEEFMMIEKKKLVSYK